MNANDRLSRATSEIVRINREASEAYDELSLFGAPLECGIGIGQAADRQVAEVLNRYGYTARELVEAVEARTSDRYVHYVLGLDAIYNAGGEFPILEMEA